MNKIDLHLHVRLKKGTEEQPRISCASDMLTHMQELGIQKGVIMSGGESDCGFQRKEGEKDELLGSFGERSQENKSSLSPRNKSNAP